MPTPRVVLLAAIALVVAATASGAVGDPAVQPQPPAPSIGTYAWPVSGSVIRAFEPPTGPFGAGHRGIDVSASSGAPVRAAEAGVVAFAGRVAGDLHVSIDHPDGVRTSYAFLGSIDVRAGDGVTRGGPVGTVGPGHPGSDIAHLHFGARYAGRYIDPMLLLERRSLVGMIHLAPVEEARTVP